MGATNGLAKRERISSKTEIELLFTKGNSFVVYPLRVIYLENVHKVGEGRPVVSIMVNVSKKKFKRAVKRNHLKRLIKESYRLNKHDFIEKIAMAYLPPEGEEGNSSKYISIAFLYLSHEEKTYFEIESAMQKALEILSVKLTETEQ